MQELETAGVYSKDVDGCIYSKRMVRDEEIRRKRADGGVLGGNPALKSGAKKEKNKPNTDESKVNLSPNLQPTPSSSSSSSSSSNTYVDQAAPVRPPCPHADIVDLYHRLLPTLPQVREWTDKRRKMLRTRWMEKDERQSLKWWSDYFTYVGQCDFLMGRVAPTPGRESFEANLEWLVTGGNLVNVIEGKYQNRAGSTRAEASVTPRGRN